VKTELTYKIIIPARGGSKRFPRKNIYPLNGSPLIAYSIKYALNYFSPENIWVNTDDTEIKDIAERFGVNVFVRSDKNGSDEASTADVLKEHSEYFLRESIMFDAVILLQVTNPLRSRALMQTAIIQFENSKRQSLATYSILNKKYGSILNNHFIPDNYSFGMRMQDIAPQYFENGLIYITKKESLLSGEIITKDTFPLIVEEIGATVDIDEPNDIYFAEFLLKHKEYESIY
jgi:N-acylneuraminate cytidylyltransferase